MVMGGMSGLGMSLRVKHISLELYRDFSNLPGHSPHSPHSLLYLYFSPFEFFGVLFEIMYIHPDKIYLHIIG